MGQLMAPQLGDVTWAAGAATHASQGSGVFEGCPGRKLVAFIHLGKEKRGFGGHELCPTFTGQHGKACDSLGFRLTIIRARRKMGPWSHDRVGEGKMTLAGC